MRAIRTEEPKLLRKSKIPNRYTADDGIAEREKSCGDSLEAALMCGGSQLLTEARVAIQRK